MSVNGDTKDSESSSVQSENAIEQNSDLNKTVNEPKLCNRCGHPVSESSTHDCIEKLVEEVAKLKTQNKALQNQVDDLLSLQDYEDDPNQDLDEDLIFIRKGPVTNTYFQYVRELKVVRKLITRFMDEGKSFQVHALVKSKKVIFCSFSYFISLCEYVHALILKNLLFFIFVFNCMHL